MKSQMDAIDKLKKSVFDDYERLNMESKFKFACHPGVACFNKCCSDVNIFLTPYDIIRLKNRLGIDSEEFLTRYTLMPIHEKQHYPVVMFKMRDDETKACHLVDPEKGCTVYEDRPWPCRMFPIGKASPKLEEANPFYFLMKEDVCVGWDEDTEWTIKGWIENQEVKKWDEAGEKFKELTLHDFFSENKLNPPQMEMFHMVAYNLDKFRLFLFNTSFFDKFDVDEETKKKIEKDDEALLDFGYEWLRFAIFREPTMKIKDEAAEAVAKKQ